MLTGLSTRRFKTNKIPLLDKSHQALIITHYIYLCFSILSHARLGHPASVIVSGGPHNSRQELGT